MTIEDILKSDLSDAQKVAMIKVLQGEKVVSHRQGGEVSKEDTKESEEKTITPTTDLIIGDRHYKVAIAKTEEEKYTGLSEITSLKKDEGMLFVYDSPQNDLWFTMEDTSVDLDIIFIDSEGEVTSVHSVKAKSVDPIQDTANNAQYVLEVPYGSGIEEGDELEDYSGEDEDLTDEEKETLSRSKMLVLDENGNVQAKLEGGERIFSRIKTKQFIKAAIKAYKSDEDSDYRRVGRIVLKELDAQDNREPEFVNAPEKN